MSRRDYWIVIVCSMEQIIGGALSTVISIMLPMMQLILHPELPALAQGIIGATGLIGIGIGSYVLGAIGDKHGYLLTFRLCPVLMLVGCAFIFFLPYIWSLVIGLLLIGIGCGGGYSLDSAYISELLPPKYAHFMIGVAKANCAWGFVGAAFLGVWVLHMSPNPHTWYYSILIVAAMALITLLMRIRWWGSPKWLVSQGRTQEAEAAAKHFLGPQATLSAADMAPAKQQTKTSFSIKQNWDKVVFSGIPWACEGVGVYGFSVFLPVLIMALGIDQNHLVGVSKIINSVEVTAIVNAFMIPGFVLGLVLLNKVNNIKMMNVGFYGSALGLVLLWLSYALYWGPVPMLAGFLIFEMALNGGPHLLTYIIPAKIYPVDLRAEGNGIAALLGKVGAVIGVIFMPMLLKWGGMALVLGTSIAVMILGALISSIYSKKIQYS